MANEHLTKRCTKCEAVKPLGAFGPHKGKPNAYPQCLECRRVQSKAVYKARRDAHLAKGKEYAQANAEKLKSYRAEYYQKNREKMDALNRDWYQRNPEVRNAVARADYAKNSEAYNERARRYREENPDKCAEITRAYREANPERVAALKRNYKARKKAAKGRHTGEDIKALYAAQEGRCAYCRVSLAPGYHVDHRLALSKGGTNWPENLQLTCEPCNLSKKDRDAPLRLNELTREQKEA
jgi:5-methylcytosine-specific restriction endonuclease McrA